MYIVFSGLRIMSIKFLVETWTDSVTVLIDGLDLPFSLSPEFDLCRTFFFGIHLNDQLLF